MFDEVTISWTQIINSLHLSSFKTSDRFQAGIQLFKGQAIRGCHRRLSLSAQDSSQLPQDKKGSSGKGAPKYSRLSVCREILILTNLYFDRISWPTVG